MATDKTIAIRNIGTKKVKIFVKQTGNASFKEERNVPIYLLGRDVTEQLHNEPKPLSQRDKHRIEVAQRRKL